MFEPNPADVEELEWLMMDISGIWSAGWMSGVEFALWDAVQGKSFWLGLVTIPKEQIVRAQHLSEKIQGWVTWPDEWKRPGYIAMDAWLNRQDFPRGVTMSTDHARDSESEMLRSTIQAIKGTLEGIDLDGLVKAGSILADFLHPDLADSVQTAGRSIREVQEIILGLEDLESEGAESE